MTRRLAAITAFLALLTAPARAGQLTLTMADGRVTLVADNVTVRQILAEWSRVGQTKIVNGERVPGGSVTLTFQNIPERQVLDTLLRTASGYVAAPRAVPLANASVFDRVLILPTASATPGAQAAGRSQAPAGGVPGRPAMPVAAAAPDPGDAGDGEEDDSEEEDPEEEDPDEQAEEAEKPPMTPGFTARPGQIDPMNMPPQEAGVVAPVPALVPTDKPGVVATPPAGRMSPFQPIQTQRPGMFVPPTQPGQGGQPQPFVPGPGQKPDEPPPL